MFALLIMQNFYVSAQQDTTETEVIEQPEEEDVEEYEDYEDEDDDNDIDNDNKKKKDTLSEKKDTKPGFVKRIISKIKFRKNTTETQDEDDSDDEEEKEDKNGFFKRMVTFKNPDTESDEGYFSRLFSGKDRKGLKSCKKPKKITSELWNIQPSEDSTKTADTIQKKRIEMLQEWVDYDSCYYYTKYKLTEKEQKALSKIEKSRTKRDQRIANKAVKKRSKIKNKIKKSKVKRIKSALKLMNNKEMSKEERLLLEKNARWESAYYEAEYRGWRETLRKEKVVKKYTRKQDKLDRKYQLSPDEKDALYKSGSMKLMGTDKMLLKKALKKQYKYKKQYEKLKKKRFMEMQDKNTRERLKQREKEKKKKERKSVPYDSEF